MLTKPRKLGSLTNISRNGREIRYSSDVATGAIRLLADLKLLFSQEILDIEKIKSTLDDFEYDLSEWEGLTDIKNNFSRNLLTMDENFSVVMIYWGKKISMPMHSHGDLQQNVFIKPIKGSLIFKRQLNNDQVEKMEVKEKTMHSDKLGVHSFGNVEEGTLSLHIYQPYYIGQCFDENSPEANIPLIYSPILTSTNFISECFVLNKLNPIDNPVHQYTNFSSFSLMLTEELKKVGKIPLENDNIPKFKKWIENLRFNKKEWSKYTNFCNKNYTRNLVSYSEQYTLMILCWSPGQKSPIHDHSSSNCFMKMLSGTLREITFNQASNPKDITVKEINELTEEKVRYIDDSLGLHQVLNADEREVAVSLHIYIPAYNTCGCYYPDLGEKKTVSLRDSNVYVKELVQVAFSDFSLSLQEFESKVSNYLDTRVLSIREEEKIREALSQLTLDKVTLETLVHFNDYNYTRILVSIDKNFSLMLICWNKGQQTPIHTHHNDHDQHSRKTWIRVLRGNLEFVKYNTPENDEYVVDKNIPLKEGSTVFLKEEDEEGYHKTRNSSFDETCISLHLYSPPYIECLGYSENSKSEKLNPCVYSSKCFKKESQLSSLIEIDNFVISPCCNLQSLLHKVSSVLTEQNPDFDLVTKYLDKVQFHHQQLMEYLNTNLEKNCRYLVSKTDLFEIYIMVYFPNQLGMIHDHGSVNKYWRKVLFGELVETIYDSKKKPFSIKEKRTLFEGSSSFTCGNVVHKLENTSNTNCMVLQILNPPMKEFKTFTIDGAFKINNKN